MVLEGAHPSQEGSAHHEGCGGVEGRGEPVLLWGLDAEGDQPAGTEQQAVMSCRREYGGEC